MEYGRLQHRQASGLQRDGACCGSCCGVRMPHTASPTPPEGSLAVTTPLPGPFASQGGLAGPWKAEELRWLFELNKPVPFRLAGDALSTREGSTFAPASADVGCVRCAGPRFSRPSPASAPHTPYLKSQQAGLGRPTTRLMARSRQIQQCPATGLVLLVVLMLLGTSKVECKAKSSGGGKSGSSSSSSSGGSRPSGSSGGSGTSIRNSYYYSPSPTGTYVARTGPTGYRATYQGSGVPR